MVLLAVSFTFVEMAKPNDVRLKRIMLGASSFLAIIFVGFRDGVGADWDAYLYIHELANITPLADYLDMSDPGYMLTGWIFSQFGLDVWATNVVCAIILMTGIFSLACRTIYPNMFFLAALPYMIIVVGMGYSRQSASIGFTCLAMSFLMIEKRVMIFFSVAASLAFHKSAAFAIAPIIATVGRRTWHNVLILALAVPAITVLVVLEGYEVAKSVYIDPEYNSSGAMIRILQIFICGLWFLLVLRHRLGHRPNNFFLMYAILGICALPAVLISPSSTLIDRLCLYLLPFQCYVLARTPEIFRCGGNRLIVQISIVAINVAIFSTWITSAKHLDRWLNYQNYIWSGNAF